MKAKNLQQVGTRITRVKDHEMMCKELYDESKEIPEMENEKKQKKVGQRQLYNEKKPLH